jgi:hypothetical protein
VPELFLAQQLHHTMHMAPRHPSIRHPQHHQWPPPAPGPADAACGLPGCVMSFVLVVDEVKLWNGLFFSHWDVQKDAQGACMHAITT